MSRLAAEDRSVATEAAPLNTPTSTTSSRRGSDTESALKVRTLHYSVSSSTAAITSTVIQLQ
jgi:hypothetical protein